MMSNGPVKIFPHKYELKTRKTIGFSCTQIKTYAQCYYKIGKNIFPFK